MCGRFSLCAGPAQLSAFFQTPAPADIEARPAIFPSQNLLVVLMGPTGRSMHHLRWGLIPSWSKEDRSSLRQINARSETAPHKPFFRQASRTRRCLIPMTGFFEWNHEVKPAQPRAFHSRSEPLLAAAGIWESWGAVPVSSCALLTRPAESPVAEFHDRMPVFLRPSQFETWLQPSPLSAKDWQNLCLGPAIELVEGPVEATPGSLLS